MRRSGVRPPSAPPAFAGISAFTRVLTRYARRASAGKPACTTRMRAGAQPPSAGTVTYDPTRAGVGPAPPPVHALLERADLCRPRLPDAGRGGGLADVRDHRQRLRSRPGRAHAVPALRRLHAGGGPDRRPLRPAPPAPALADGRGPRRRGLGDCVSV